jgi:hypothetical protein
MARWSSSASELVDVNRAHAAAGAARADIPLIWTLRPGLLAGSPWPGLAIGLVFGVPALVVVAWAVAWLGGGAASLLSFALAWPAWLWWRGRGRVRGSDPRAAHGLILRWHGPWPGELAQPVRLRKTPKRSRSAQPEPDGPGFVLNGEPVWPRVRLQWGPHVCLQCSAQDWAWLSLGSSAADRALLVLLRTLNKPEAPSHAVVPGAQAGGSADAVASCEAWNDAITRRRAQARAQRSDLARADTEDSDDFPATTIMMKHDTGTELEPRRPHG